MSLHPNQVCSIELSTDHGKTYCLFFGTVIDGNDTKVLVMIPNHGNFWIHTDALKFYEISRHD